jgi:hypothetical protein
MKPIASCLVALATATACTTPAPQGAPPSVEQAPEVTWAKIGQKVSVSGPKVTPLTIVEDSRCPTNLQCVWAGRVRLSVRVDLGSSSQVRELTQGVPTQVADGTLELTDVQPGKPAGDQPTIAPQDYRFGFRFMGGL